MRGLHRKARVIFTVIVMCAFCVGAPLIASAQDERPSPLADAIKHTLFDPTTYAPGAISYHATMRDWNTSQPFFQHGFVEHNERFTISGLADDTAVDYATGRRRILTDALETVAITAVHNITTRLIEDALVSRHPEHRKLFHVLGWAERIAVASAMSYELSAAHYRQAQRNEQQAAALGLR
jgi:hypothetical protein